MPFAPGARQPLVWLLGAHGGAGISTLGHVLDFAGECGRKWPGGFEGESPFVVVVAKENVFQLRKAGDLLRQHVAGLAGDSTLVGLVTVADRPTRMPKEIQQTREVVAGLAAADWRVGWVEHYTLVRDPTELPVWSPNDPPPEKKKRAASPDFVPTEVADLGAGLRDSIIAHLKTGS